MTIATIECDMMFPVLFSDDLGLAFVSCGVLHSDLTLLCLIVNEETNVRNIGIKGAKPGMNFREIQDRLGESEITKTWLGNEDNTAYTLDYVANGLIYNFVSYEQDGTGSVLYIHLVSNRGG